MKISKHKSIQLLSISLGALAGFLYWRFIGCTSGTCPIQSHWAGSTLLGALLGSIAGDLFSKKEKEKPASTKVISNGDNNE